MKNYPNQASNFQRIRRTLAVIGELNVTGGSATSDVVLGYTLAERRVYTFRNLDYDTLTDGQLASRIQVEQRKPPPQQGVRTNARELRRTLRDMGWIDHNAVVTPEGHALLASQPNSVDEQALLVEGLLEIEATLQDGSSPHHPIPVLLKLLADAPSLHREGLELALAPNNDSDAEFARIRALYRQPRADRMKQLDVTESQRANALKIFPTLAVTAGLVIVDDEGYYSLSQDGWKIIGQAPAAAKSSIKKGRGRRMTVGRMVSGDDVGKKRVRTPPRTLTKEEQLRAAERLLERTNDHQDLVTRMADHIGKNDGNFFIDEFSFDMLWLAHDVSVPGVLFEMKTITGASDAYARIRDAIGQLTYYHYFHIAPMTQDRPVVRVAVFDGPIPDALSEFLEFEKVGAIQIPKGGEAQALNDFGKAALALLPQK